MYSESQAESAQSATSEKIKFRLWAPGKKYVSVVGNFNQWNGEEFPLQLDKEGWWTGERDFPVGLHRYQFFVKNQDDKEFYIADPLSRVVNWETRRRMPETEFTVGQEAYAWEDSKFKTPSMHQSIIYEIHVGNFTPEGNFIGLKAKLPYLKELGINVIELMPVSEFFGTGKDDWGYEPSFYTAVEGSYGSINDLKDLVNEAHKLGIAVVLDMVFNHCGHTNPLVQLFENEKNPYLSDEKNDWGLPDFNHWQQETKKLFWEVQEYWLKEFHIDGFRYDSTSGIGFDAENGVQYLTWAARKIKPDALLIAENLQDPLADVRGTEIQSTWHEEYVNVIRPLICERDIGDNSCKNIEGAWRCMSHGFSGYTDNAQAINYFETHDHERLAAFIKEKESLRNDDALFAKIKLALVTLVCSSGVPLIYAGQEMAVENKKGLEGSKLDWSLAENDLGKRLLALMKDVCKLRWNNPALTLNTHELIAMDPGKLVLVFKRWDEGGNCLVIALNFSPSGIEQEAGFPESGKWKEVFEGHEVEAAGDNKINLILPPSGAQVWKKV